MMNFYADNLFFKNRALYNPFSADAGLAGYVIH